MTPPTGLKLSNLDFTCNQLPCSLLLLGSPCFHMDIIYEDILKQCPASLIQQTTN